ncbi:MAG TPA: FMN-binding protein [Rubrivivax sp.]|nr:FMN-binding protein [Rubrivivax sp.]HPO19024.1 FMN-binding protein [Rubrivivax sp.]
MASNWHALPLAVLLAAPVVQAVEYLGVQAAQKLAFPEATAFVPVPLALDADARTQLDAVARPPGARDPKVWRALAGSRTLGTFFVDAVIGKQDYIVYALALDASGRVLRLEVLEYRETHGWEIRNERWRAQFTGKSASDAVRLNDDIANISGATLSCRHVSDGVRRLLALHALLPA